MKTTSPFQYKATAFIQQHVTWIESKTGCFTKEFLVSLKKLRRQQDIIKTMPSNGSIPNPVYGTSNTDTTNQKIPLPETHKLWPA